VGEREIAERTGTPNTEASLVADLRRLGVREGMTLIVHSSLGSLGWTCGGAAAVVLALEGALTPRGTLVMPTHSGDYSDPEHWGDPPVPSAWFGAIREGMPLFDPDLAPTRGMGAIPETFRKQRGVVRSRHPAASFAAWGRRKRGIVAGQGLDYCQDSRSPLGEVYKRDGRVLLLGVGYGRCTSLHLAEYLADYPGKQKVRDGFPWRERGRRVWRESEDILYRDKDFEEIGRAFEEGHEVARGKVGLADSRLLRQRELVDFAVGWMLEHRS
jgi:aminoglycoside 3-N-acetyltransferase